MFECLWSSLKTLAFLGAYNLNKVVLRQVHETNNNQTLPLAMALQSDAKPTHFVFYLSFSFGLSHVKYAQHSPVDQTMMRLLIS
jgi:hypothetical protein